MSKTYSPLRFVLQWDWNASISNESDTFWAGLKGAGKNSVYCKFFSGSSDDSEDSGETKIHSSDPNFEGVFNQKQHSLCVSDPSTGFGTTFFAPSAIGARIHSKNIYSMDVSAGGLGVSSDSVGNLNVWETKSFETRRFLHGHLGDTYTCKFFPSGLVVLSGGADMQLKIWSVETGECARTLIGHHQAITDVGFVDRGRNILSCSKDGTCRLWDCSSGSCLASVKPDGDQVNALSLVARTGAAKPSSDEKEVGTENKLLGLACRNGALFGYGLGDRIKVFEAKCDSPVNACAFLDENTLIGGTDTGSVYALDVRKPNSFLYVIKEDRGNVWSIHALGKGYWVSFGDGSVCYRTGDPSGNGGFSPMELSGSDCDPVYRVCSDGSNLYTCCRDAKIRKYVVENSNSE